MIKLYTTHCPLCEKLEERLIDAGIEYEAVTDQEEIEKFCTENEIDTVPLLEMENLILSYRAAMDWLRGELVESEHKIKQELHDSVQ